MKRKQLIMLPLLSLGVLAGVYCFSAIQSSTPSATQVCKRHNMPLQQGTAPIQYGLIQLPPSYLQDEPELFPHAKEWILGGCVIREPKAQTVLYCEQCRETARLWQQQYQRIGKQRDAKILQKERRRLELILFPSTARAR